MIGPGATERLRLASIEAAVRARPREDCPATAEIWDAATGDLSVDSANALVLHTVECASCAEAWRLANEVRRDAGLEATLPRARRSFRAWMAAAAAVAVVLIGSGAWLWMPTSGPGRAPSNLRAPEAVAPEPAIRSSIPEDALLDPSDCRLAWRGPAGAVYRVRVTSADLTPLFEANDLREGELLVPASALEALPAGTTLIWVVSATLPDGSRTEEAFTSTLDGTP